MIDYLLSISTDVLASVVLTAVVLIGVAAYHLPRRLRARRFFSVHDGGDVSILLSNVWVERSRGATPLVTGYQGQASSLGEYRFASELARTIERDSAAPRVLQPFLNADPDGARRSRKARVEIGLAPSFIDPRNPSAFTPVQSFEDLPEDVRGRTMALVSGNRTLVLVGSKVYNAAVLYVTEALGAGNGVSFVEVPDPDRPDATVRAIRTPAGDFLRRRSTDADGRTLNHEYCILQAVRGWPHKQTVIFLCSGFSTVSTVAALRVLTGWDELRRMVGNRSFVAVYEVLAPGREFVDDTGGDDVRVRCVYLSTPSKKRATASTPERVKDPVQQARNV